MSNARDAVSRDEISKTNVAPWEKRVTKFNRRKMPGMGTSNDGKSLKPGKTARKRGMRKAG